MPPAAPPNSERSRRPFRVELTESESARLVRIAEAEGTSAEEVLRDIVRDGLRSAHDRADDLAGCLDGPRDLAANPAHLAGFGA